MSDLELLRFIVDPTERALDHWAAWSDGTDIDHHSPVAFEMFSATYRKMERLGIDHEWRPRLRGAHRREWALQQMSKTVVDQACAVLDNAGVDHLLPIERAMRAGGAELVPIRGDHRIVVRWAEIGRAMQAFDEAGWQMRRAPRRLDPRPRLNVIADGVRSPHGEWIVLSDHYLSGYPGRRASERVWNGATAVGASHSYVPSVPDLARAIAADPAGGIESVDFALRLQALCSLSGERVVVATESTSRRAIDTSVDARLAWFESLGAPPITRVEVDDAPPNGRTLSQRLSDWSGVVARWGGPLGAVRSFAR